MSSSADSDWRDLDTTPEFREFVGKKLDQVVECMIKEKDRCKHLRPVPVEGSVQLFSGAPPLQVADEAAPEPAPKRPRLAGVDLQKYQLKKKSRCERRPTAGDGRAAPPDASSSALGALSPPQSETGAAAAPGDGSSDSSDDEDLARFAEAAVPADFMSALATSKTVKLDAT
ncbi:uncharacterized protein LOC119107005 [Pollicipes pollicipes]|uniref:uncharacterized protein LOC119107005 n=1 Tax=Pollicipes pollicipes TaxID=41117 RepID=UPI001884E97F|nr:uncharacterized protein LOC119107005 [Pollicipes pollicipes]